MSPARLVGVHVSVFGTPSCVGRRRPARCSSAEAWSSPAWGGPAPLLRPRPWVGCSTASPLFGSPPETAPAVLPPVAGGAKGNKGGGGAGGRRGAQGGGAKRKKASSTPRDSQAVPHPSTNRALRCLTAEFGRDPVFSTRYGRWHFAPFYRGAGARLRGPAPSPLPLPHRSVLSSYATRVESSCDDARAVSVAFRAAVGRASQRSLHNEPIFRLLLKVAVKGTH